MTDFIGFLLLGGLKSTNDLNSWVGRFFSARKEGPDLGRRTSYVAITRSELFHLEEGMKKNDSNGGIYTKNTM